jgi:HAD superfamily hydrolase (TIGR01509 family)
MREPSLIFDFGNVVCFFDYLRAFATFGRGLGMPGPVLRQLLQDRGFARLHTRFEEGGMEPEEFAAQVMALAGLELPYEDFVRGWEDIFWLNEPVAQLLALLKSRGYPLLLGSNTNILHSTFFRRRFAPTFDGFNRLILSHEVGHMKPDRRFYQACVAAAGVPAASCLFIDDLPENVEGARQAGLTGLHYVDTPTLIDDLRSHGVEIPPGEG